MSFKLHTGVIGLTVLGTVAGYSVMAANANSPAKIKPTSSASANSSLNVEVTGLRNRTGQICLSLFTDPKAFPTEPDRAVINRCDKIVASPMVVTFKNLPAGNYAIALIHDANGDREANRNFLGVPTEGFGFSQNPAVRTSAPKFNESAVAVAGPSTTIKIKVQYLMNR